MTPTPTTYVLHPPCTGPTTHTSHPLPTTVAAGAAHTAPGCASPHPNPIHSTPTPPHQQPVWCPTPTSHGTGESRPPARRHGAHATPPVRTAEIHRFLAVFFSPLPGGEKTRPRKAEAGRAQRGGVGAMFCPTRPPARPPAAADRPDYPSDRPLFPTGSRLTVDWDVSPHHMPRPLFSEL